MKAQTSTGEPVISEWYKGQVSGKPVVTLGYRTYSAVGWTIDASDDGTRFTNDGTGHGMVIAVEGVQAF